MGDTQKALPCPVFVKVFEESGGFYTGALLATCFGQAKKGGVQHGFMGTKHVKYVSRIIHFPPHATTWTLLTLDSRSNCFLI
jgi:hypothetical protein